MSSILSVLFLIIVVIATVSQKKAQEAARRQRGSNLPPRNQYRTPPQGKASQTSVGHAVPDAGRVLQNVDRRVRPREKTGRGRSFEKHAGERDTTFLETSSAADVKYTTSGCGCNASGNASAGKSHGHSNAMYDEARFFEEAQEMRKGNWT